jgi:hypothetical protein
MKEQSPNSISMQQYWQLTALLPGGGFINELVANQLKLP